MSAEKLTVVQATTTAAAIETSCVEGSSLVLARPEVGRANFESSDRPVRHF